MWKWAAKQSNVHANIRVGDMYFYGLQGKRCLLVGWVVGWLVGWVVVVWVVGWLVVPCIDSFPSSSFFFPLLSFPFLLLLSSIGQRSRPEFQQKIGVHSRVDSP